MIERLNSENQTSLLAAQFVPLKVDTTSPEWRSWNSKYKHEGNSIPIVFVIRADGEMLYGKSGSLPGEQLQQLLTQSLTQAGTMLSEKQLTLVEKASENLAKAQKENDWAAISKALRQAKSLGSLGGIGSYAKVSLQLDESIQTLGKESLERLKSIEAEIKDEMSANDKLNVAKNFLLAKNEVGRISSLSPEISKLLKSIERNPLVRETISEVKSSGVSLVDSKTETKVESASEEMTEETKQETNEDILVSADSKSTKPLQSWTSDNGRFTIKAELVGVEEEGFAVLKKPDGEVVRVRIARLTKADQDRISQFDQ